jgi:hypothetical protein
MFRSNQSHQLRSSPHARARALFSTHRLVSGGVWPGVGVGVGGGGGGGGLIASPMCNAPVHLVRAA